MTRTRLLTATLVTTLALAAPASAHDRRPVKPPLPNPMPQVVKMTAADPMYNQVAGYYDGEVIHVADPSYKFGVRHELGHVFDEQYLDAGERQRFATLQAGIYNSHDRLVGHDGTQDTPWLSLAEDPGSDIVTSSYGDIGEIFADAYAACRSGYIRGSGHLWETAYGYDPNPRQHREICKFIAKTALDPGTPLDADSWR